MYKSPSWLSSIHLCVLCVQLHSYCVIAALYWSIMVRNWWCNLCPAPRPRPSHLFRITNWTRRRSWSIMTHLLAVRPPSLASPFTGTMNFSWGHSVLFSAQLRISCTWRFVCTHFVGDCSHPSILYYIHRQCGIQYYTHVCNGNSLVWELIFFAVSLSALSAWAVYHSIETLNLAGRAASVKGAPLRNHAVFMAAAYST